MEIVFQIIYIILSLLIVFFIGLTIILISDITMHRTMTLKYSKIYGYGNFKLFIKEFNKTKWKIESEDEISFRDYKTDSQVANNIIKFNGMGMLILNPIEFLKVKWHIRQIHKTFLIARKRTWE